MSAGGETKTDVGYFYVLVGTLRVRRQRGSFEEESLPPLSRPTLIMGQMLA